jgi:hypothetical protein
VPGGSTYKKPWPKKKWRRKPMPRWDRAWLYIGNTDSTKPACYTSRFCNPTPRIFGRRTCSASLRSSKANAHTSACDSLWAGLPMLTYAGEAFASRVAASLLRAVGLPAEHLVISPDVK